ncbi:hypothetical protein HAX54_022141 [Datura stramonium]|uniref:Pectin acetylesterase n=1 Tax=Datura stramonium TaxID=4076 RepID=A0ABS8UTS9_DATST|nr:hypothetical protein [Datura stramonium]
MWCTAFSLVVPYVQTPLFIINSVYDTAFGVEFLKTFKELPPSFTRDYFLTSCYSHGDLRIPAFWFSASSPRLLNKTMNEAVADWYFERARVSIYRPVPLC